MADKLLRMAGQMADFFRHQTDAPAPQAIADHINTYWSYRMRSDFLAQIAAGAETDPLVFAAAEFVTLPADPEAVA